MENLTLFGLDIQQIMNTQKFLIIVRIVLLIFIGLPFVFIVSRWIKRFSLKKFTQQQAMIFEKLVLYSGIVIIAISILNDFGFKLAHLLGAAGILGIAIGFASQTSVSNIISGLFLIGEKPFEIGDIITVGTTKGVVMSIDTLSIKLRTFDNKLVRIPNESIIKSEVTNITRFPIRRVDINLGVAYKEDLKRVKTILSDVAQNNPLCLMEPEPIIIFQGFGNSSVDIFFGVWAAKNDWLALKNSIMEDIKKRFDEEGIEIPFPHVSLYSGSASQAIPIKIIDGKNNATKR